MCHGAEMPETAVELARHRPDKMPARSVVRPITDHANRAVNPDSMWSRVAAWLLPWSFYAYPGRLRGMCHLLGQHVQKSTLTYWQREDRPPLWAVRLAAERIEAESLEGLRLVEELRAYEARQHNRPPKGPPARAKV
jgi:hypothetical protein